MLCLDCTWTLKSITRMRVFPRKRFYSFLCVAFVRDFHFYSIHSSIWGWRCGFECVGITFAMDMFIASCDEAFMPWLGHDHSISTEIGLALHFVYIMHETKIEQNVRSNQNQSACVNKNGNVMLLIRCCRWSCFIFVLYTMRLCTLNKYIEPLHRFLPPLPSCFYV